MLRSALLTVLLPALVSASPPPEQKCEPAPAVVQTPTTPAHSTYTSDAEPPKRFAVAPKGFVKVSFGQEATDRLCGIPPCGFRWVGCRRGDEVALPDPYTTDDATFAHAARHELAHFAGWPATHGD